MFIERLKTEEIKEIVEVLVEKYDLRKNSIFSVCEISNDESCDETIVVHIEKIFDANGIDRGLYRDVLLSDFDFGPLNLYNEDSDNITHDYRRIMYAKFGEKYKKELIKSLLEDKLQRIKDLDEELEERNLAAIEELTKQK